MTHSGTFSQSSQNFQYNYEKFQSFLDNGRIQIGMIDGLDGSGKQSAAREVANLLSKNGVSTLIVAYPYDFSATGKLLRKYLLNNWTEQGQFLELPSRRTLYALNRAQSIAVVIKRALEIEKEFQTPLKIIFDRCPTSILVTFSAEKLAQANGGELIITEQDVSNELKEIEDIDEHFIKTFRLIDIPAHIPMVSPDATVEAIKLAVENGERKVKDVYEKSDIQNAARISYLIAARLFPKRFHVFSQMIHGSETRMSKEEIGQILFDNFAWNAKSSTNVPHVENLSIDIDSQRELINPADEEAVLSKAMATKVRAFIQPYVNLRVV